MDDLEAARSIDQALQNVRKDYPDDLRAEAWQSYGRLIAGRLGIMTNSVIVIPEKEGDIVKVIPRWHV